MNTCMCCPAFRPRYKRLVDNIFPANSEDGLVRSEMEKLTYYAVSAPEKLDRIGDYLAHKLTRHISRRRDAYVFVAMEALDQLLLACHAQQINSFVESFLRMVANLLESDNLDFQAVGTNSFVKFSKIEEDNPSYHRRYEFFVSKFSAMCHSNLSTPKNRKRIQGHGVRGIQGIVRKTVDDELQVNIWQKHHMDKIVPSLLYVMMQDNDQESPGRRDSHQHKDVTENISLLAENCLRELLSRASYSNVGAAIEPALAHLDNHKKWNPENAFAIRCFKVFMYAIQAQYSHILVKAILDHLDQKDANEGELKAHMLEVLCTVVAIPSTSPIGPAVIEVFNQLVRHLEYSIDCKSYKEQDTFQHAFIDTIGSLCDVLPEYQKLEAMVFFINKGKEIVNKVDGENLEYDQRSEKLLSLTLQSLHRIAQNYTSKHFAGVSSSLVDPLIKVSYHSSPENRLIAQHILVRLFDKNKNFDKLTVVNLVSDLEELNLTVTEARSEDQDLIERKLPGILHFIYESAHHTDNISPNYVALYKCVCMLCVSISSPEVTTDLCRIMLALQDSVARPQSLQGDVDLDPRRKTLLMNTVAICMCAISFTSNVPAFRQYVTGIMRTRLKDDKNKNIFDPIEVFAKSVNSLSPFPDNIDDVFLFSANQIQAALNDSKEFKVDRICQPFVPVISGEAESIQIKRSVMDAESVQIEMGAPSEDEKESDDGMMSAKNITYDYVKKKLMEPAPLPSEIEERKQKAAKHVMTSTFEQLVTEMQSRMPDQNQLMEIIKKSINEKKSDVTLLPFALPGDCKPNSNNIVFPSICVL